VEKKFAVTLFCGNLFLRIAKKKIAKIRTRKNLVPHGKWVQYRRHTAGGNPAMT